MAEHSLLLEHNLLTVKGVASVVEISDKQAVFKLNKESLTVRGSALNAVRLDREQGIVVLECGSVSSLTYRRGASGIMGLLK